MNSKVDIGHAQLRAARLYALSRVDLHVGQPRQVCHGIPGDKVLKDGDIVNIDVTVIKDGWHGDTSRMFYVGEPSIQARRLVEVTYECMWRGIAQVRPGGTSGRHRPRDPEACRGPRLLASCANSAATASAASSTRSRRCCTTASPGTGIKLEPGMIFTVEPMINAGRREIRELADGWTIVTADHRLSAQWEHTVLVTETGYEVLTLSAGSRPPPRSFSIAAAPDGVASTDQATCRMASSMSARPPARRRPAMRRAPAKRDRTAFAHNRRPDSLLAELRAARRPHAAARIAASSTRCPPGPRWSRSAATAAASSSRISDVDVLVLLPSRPSAGRRAPIERLIAALWDIGLELGHSVRTVDECNAEAAKTSPSKPRCSKRAAWPATQALIARSTRHAANARRAGVLPAPRCSSSSSATSSTTTRRTTSSPTSRKPRRPARPADRAVDRARGRPRQDLARARPRRPDDRRRSRASCGAPNRRSSVCASSCTCWPTGARTAGVRPAAALAAGLRHPTARAAAPQRSADAALLLGAPRW